MLTKIVKYAAFAFLLLTPTKADDYNNYIMTSDEQQTMLDETNAKRALHENTPPVSWSNDLAIAAAKFAINYTCNGVLTHSDYPDYGENLAIGYSPEGAVDAWYNEISKWDWNNPQFSSSTGHFTQLIWNTTDEIGCAIKYCDAYWGSYIVCEYNPFGNEVWDMGDHVNKLKPVTSSVERTSSSTSTVSTKSSSLRAASNTANNEIVHSSTMATSKSYRSSIAGVGFSRTVETTSTTISKKFGVSSTAISSTTYVTVPTSDLTATFNSKSIKPVQSGGYANVTSSDGNNGSKTGATQRSSSISDHSLATKNVDTTSIISNNARATGSLSTDNSAAIYTIFTTNVPTSIVKETVTYVTYTEVTITSCIIKCQPSTVKNVFQTTTSVAGITGKYNNIGAAVARVQSTFASEGVTSTKVVKVFADVTETICSTCTEISSFSSNKTTEPEKTTAFVTTVTTSNTIQKTEVAMVSSTLMETASKDSKSASTSFSFVTTGSPLITAYEGAACQLKINTLTGFFLAILISLL